MKKVLLSLASAVLLLSSCSNDDNIQTESKTGDLVTKISFDGIAKKAASSTAIPVTSWSNVNKMQLFLYKSGGAVAFSAVLDPSEIADDVKTYTWKSIPEGTYELALVANIKSDEDNVDTYLDGGTTKTKFEQYNVLSRKLNSELFIDLKELSDFPTGHTFESTDVPYAPASEVFTAYASGVKIEEGKKNDLTNTPLKLRREISLMRVRIDRTDKPESAPALSTVNFSHDRNYITVEKLPVGLGVKLDSFEGGIYATASDANRIMIGGTGTSTYNDADPTTGYDPKVIVDPNFTLWKDIRVLPNATKADAIASDADAAAERRYVITITGWAPKDYEYADGYIAPQAQPVYWSGTVKGVFSPNIIREVNMNILSKGHWIKPKPQPEGELHIKVEAPEDWNTNIESEDLDV